MRGREVQGRQELRPRKEVKFERGGYLYPVPSRKEAPRTQYFANTSSETRKKEQERRERRKKEKKERRRKEEKERKENRKIKSKLKVENLGLEARVLVRTEGWQFRSMVENSHWQVILTALAIAIFIMMIPGGKAEKMVITENHEVILTKSESAFLLDSKAFQENLCSSAEYFSKEPLIQLRKKLNQWQELAAQWDKPKEVLLEKIKDVCPSVGVGHSAENPIIGPFPKYLDSLPRSNPYIVTANREDGKIQCSYTFGSEFIAGENIWGENQIKQLFAKECRNQIERGMIVPKQAYLTHTFESKERSNALACAELCMNEHEKALFNASCSEAAQTYTECPTVMPRCHYWSFNPKTSFCLLYMNKQIEAHEKKVSKYDRFNQESGSAADSITGPVFCGNRRQQEKLWIRSGQGQDHWIPVRGACKFQRQQKISKVFARCHEAAAMMGLVLAQLEDKISRFNEKYKLKLASTTPQRRERRSHGVIPHQLISPELQKFLISTMAATLPTISGFSMASGPVIGTFLYLASSLITLLVQLAQDNDQEVLSKGLMEPDRAKSAQVDREWDRWRQSNLLNVPGKEKLGFFDSNYPLSGLYNMSRQLEDTLTAFGKVIEEGRPITPKIVRQIGDQQFSYLTVDTEGYVKKIYFFTKINKRIKKRTISVFLSLDPTAPLKEGQVNGMGGLKKITNPTIQCTDVFRRTKRINSACFDTSALGSTWQDRFLIGRELYVVKILGQRIVQIHCPQSSLTTFSAGILIFLASASCKINVDGNIYFQAEQSKLGTYNIIWEAKLNASGIEVHLPKRLQAGIQALQERWTGKSIWILVSSSLCWISILMAAGIKAYHYRTRRNKMVIRYERPKLLPMKNLNKTSFPINDIKESKLGK